jgi:hypothetical protein
MTSLPEIEAAAAELTLEEKQELIRFLTASLREAGVDPESARLVEDRGDLLLAAPAGAPRMTPKTVKEILGDWP